jgi:lipoprotein-releasing system permease protein
MSEPRIQDVPPRQLPFSLFMALRYLKPKRTFVSLITTIAIAGVTLGVAVLLLVISVMTGFQKQLEEKVLAFEAHLVVGTTTLLENWQEALEQTSHTRGVTAGAPFVIGPVILQFGEERLTPNIRGVDPQLEEGVTDIKSQIAEGELNLTGDHAVLGAELAETLGARVGDTVTVYSPANIGPVIDELEQMEGKRAEEKTLAEIRAQLAPRELKVSGIFRTGHYRYDSEFLLVPLRVGQDLYSLGNAVHGLALKTEDPLRAEEYKAALNQTLSPPLFASTWVDQNRGLLETIQMSRNLLFFLLLFIILVAAFGIMNTLITVTVRKRREIGLMKALGANAWQITWVFLGQGIVVGTIGTALGLAAGMVLMEYRNPFSRWLASTLHIELFPREIYQFSEIPAQIVPQDVAIICLSALLICSAAAWIPAWFAARLDPVKALRNE